MEEGRTFSETHSLKVKKAFRVFGIGGRWMPGEISGKYLSTVEPTFESKLALWGSGEIEG